LLVDCDVQGHCAIHLGVDSEIGLGELIKGDANPEGEAVEVRPGLYLLAGGSGVSGVERLIITRPAEQERVLSRALKPYEDHHFDYVVLDCPPGFSALSINAVVYAQELLVPVSMEVLAVTGLIDIEEELAELQEYDIDISVEIAWILPTFADRRNVKTSLITEQLRKRCGERVLDPIRFSVRFSESPGLGQTIVEYDTAGKGTKDYGELCRRLA
jgi:chromosome partitioning protein